MRLDARARGLLVILAAAAGIVVDVTLHRQGAGALARADSTLLFAAGAAAIAAGALRAATRSGRARASWLLLAVAAAVELSARAVWSSTSGVHPIPLLAAGLHATAAVLAAVAVLRMRIRTVDRAAARRMLLDAATVLVAVVLVTGSAVFANGHPAGGVARPVAIALTVCDVLLAVFGLVVLSCARYPGGLSLRSLLPVCAGVVALAAGDAGAVGAAVTGSHSPGAPPAFLIAGGLCLLAIGALASESEDVAVLRERIAVCAAVVPVVLAALAVVGFQLTEGKLPSAVAFAVVVMSALLLLRLAVALLDNLQLSRTLELQVAERTLEIVTREQWFRSLVQHSSDVVTVVDGNGIIRYQSPAVERVFGYDPATVVGQPLISFVPEAEVSRVSIALARAAGMPGSSYVLEFPVAHSDGSTRDTETVVTSLLDVPDVKGVVLNTRDVTERKQLQQRLTHQAYYDALTGLANRALFQYELAAALPDATSDSVAVLFCDLDGFKAVNDSQGHDVGDALLRIVGERLRRCVRPEDLVARFGGDEFAVLVRKSDALQSARDIARRVASSLQAPIALDGRELRVGVSIGIAAASATNDTADVLLRNADLAMYRAKADRHQSVVVFEPAMHDALLARLQVEDDLRSALGSGELVLHYQPTVDLDTGVTVGVEALMRWYRPGRGIVAPIEFIEIAEENGFIDAMGRWALFEACRQAAQWQSYAPTDRVFSVGVNISARQVTPALVDQVAAAVAEAGIAPSTLLLEMTESVLLGRTEEAIEVLRALKRLGVRIGIDDFGTGFSSLSYLSRFPVDVLKIDKNFIDAVDRPGERAELARTIVGLGRSLRVTTIAEGIERQPQAVALRTMGCDLGQGYLFSRPIPATGVTELLHLATPSLPAQRTSEDQILRSTAVTRPRIVASSPGIGA